MIEGSDLIPNCTAEALPDNGFRLLSDFVRCPVLLKGVGDGKLGHDIKHLE